MKKRCLTCILIALMYCLKVNVIVSDIYYTAAFLIYCTVLVIVFAIVYAITKIKHYKCMKKFQLYTQNIIKNIS